MTDSIQADCLACNNSILWVFGVQRLGAMLEEDQCFSLLAELHLQAILISLH